MYRMFIPKGKIISSSNDKNVFAKLKNTPSKLICYIDENGVATVYGTGKGKVLKLNKYRLRKFISNNNRDGYSVGVVFIDNIFNELDKEVAVIRNLVHGGIKCHS